MTAPSTRHEVSAGAQISIWVCCFAYLYLLLFKWPNVPFFHGADQMVYLENARRMLAGHVIYRDFFEFLAPGTDLVYLSLFKIFGVRAWIANFALLVLGLSLTSLIVVTARKVLDEQASYFAGLLFLTLAFRMFLDGTHHWYSVLSTMAATAVLIEERTSARICAAGFLCGTAVFFTTGRGLLGALGLAVFLIWEQRRKNQTFIQLIKNEVLLLGTFVATVLVENAYFLWKVGPQTFFHWVLVFGVKYYPTELYNTWWMYFTDVPPPAVRTNLVHFAICLFIYTMLPLIYFLFMVRAGQTMRTHPSEQWNRLMLINLTGLFLFFSVAYAPNWRRLSMVSPPAWILLVWFIQQPGKFTAARRTLLSWGIILLMLVTPWKTQRAKAMYLDTPTGRTVCTDPLKYLRQRWIQTRTKPGDFLLGTFFPDSYYWALLQNPSDVPFLTRTDYTRPEQVERLVEALDSLRVHYVLWALALDIPRPYPQDRDNLGPLRDYVRSHYHVVETFPEGDQAWERNP